MYLVLFNYFQLIWNSAPDKKVGTDGWTESQTDKQTGGTIPIRLPLEA